MAKSKDITVVFGRAVRLVRARRNLSQEELADESGLDRSYVGGVERGSRNPSLAAIAKIAKGLGVSLSDLFAECDTSSNSSARSARR